MRPASSCKALHEGTERCLRAFEAVLIESFQKRERDRRKREKRKDKVERRRERADLKQRREADALKPSSGSVEGLPVEGSPIEGSPVEGLPRGSGEAAAPEARDAT